MWAPSTWEGTPTVHDTTTSSTRQVRQMMETEDEFGVESTTEVERGLDGTLYSMRSVANENGARTSTSELRWTGTGYAYEAHVGASVETREVPVDRPAHVDPEALLSASVAAGKVKVGDRFVCRQVDVRARKVVEWPVEIVGREPGPGPNGDVPCLKAKVTDPDTGTESLWWFDAEGVVAKVKTLSSEIVRVAERTARKRPARPYSFQITTPSTPPLERMFSARRALVDVHLRPDPDRPLPEFPASPWSRVTSVDGDAKKGWVAHVELTAYDAPPDARATIPVTDPAFAGDLESTALMPCDHVDVKTAAARAVNGATDARTAAERIAAFVYRLHKQSADVGEATALEILKTMRGDCSEHATLFVALCRAAGIPARKCSGYVCVGEQWGAHAWAEIWVGAWMGVDPTTQDVGTAARYVFFGYDDRADAKAGVVSARARGRMRFVTTHLDEGDDHVDFRGPETWVEVDEAGRRARHHLLGIDVRGWRDDWHVTMSPEGGCHLSSPLGSVFVRVMADQGLRGPRLRGMASGGGEPATFAGAEGYEARRGGTSQIVLGSRRRIVFVNLNATGDDDAAEAKALAALRAEAERVLAPTFAPVPKAP
ncbi:MAG: transglutaminase domain-containing protein [Planctomycetota bacterium]